MLNNRLITLCLKYGALPLLLCVLEMSFGAETQRGHMHKEEKTKLLRALFANRDEKAKRIWILIEHGEELQAGDEVYNDDFGEWERITKPDGKIKGGKDQIRRSVVNADNLLGQLVTIFELADREDLDRLWWDRMDVFIAQAKRHLGQKTLEMYRRE